MNAGRNEEQTHMPAVVQPSNLIAKIAARYSVEPGKMLATLKQTAFRQREGEVSNEQMMALLIVADQYRLNPFTREIYAFPDRNAGIVPVVGVDGWARIINEHPQFDGVEFAEAPAPDGEPPAWIECTIHRKDRAHPTRVREHLIECRRDVAPWRSHPRRLLRHKTLIQCSRIAFGFVGIYDEDEAARIVDVSATDTARTPPAPVAPAPAALPAYPQERWDASFAAWRTRVAAGVDPDAIIRTIATKYTLTDEQQAAIRALAQPVEETDDGQR